MEESVNMISNTGERAQKASAISDPIQAIKDFYFRKGKMPESEINKVPLIPTKAALFGLDQRFREIDEKRNAKKHSKRPAFEIGSEQTCKNRHLYPQEQLIQSKRYNERKREHFSPGTCFDIDVEKKLNERLPETVSYLNYKDLQPKKVLTQEEKEKKHIKFLQSLYKSPNEIAYIELSKKLDEQ